MTSTRSVRAMAVLVVLTLALVGCGSDGSGDAGPTDDAAPSETSAAVVLTQGEAEEALLTSADIGPEFVETEPDDSEESDGGDLGCLTDLDELDQSADAATEAEVQFDDEFGVQVSNFVASFESTDDVEQALTTILNSLQGCTSVEAEDDGVQFSLEVDVDDTPANADVDQQVNVTAFGTGTSEGLELPFAIGYSLARIDNNLTAVAVFELGGSERLFAYTETAVARLDAVMKGEPVPTPEVDEALQLDLSEGSVLTLAGNGDDGVASPDLLVDVGFDSLECEAVLPSSGLDPDTYEVADFVAADGDVACLVSLSVTNVSNVPVFFAAEYDSTLLTADGKQYAPTGQPYSGGDIALQRGTGYAPDGDLINPDKTDYDYIIYEIPEGAEPVALVFDPSALAQQ